MAKESKAIKPDVFNRLPVFEEEEEKDISGLSEEEKVLASGAKTTFWKVLKEYIEEVVNNLDEVNEMAISQGADYEEIGKNAIVVSATKGIIKKIINKVEDSREESEKARKA
jgi:hypothetical protein